MTKHLVFFFFGGGQPGMQNLIEAIGQPKYYMLSFLIHTLEELKTRGQLLENFSVREMLVMDPDISVEVSQVSEDRERWSKQ